MRRFVRSDLRVSLTAQILMYLREQFGRGTFAEGDFVGLVWDGLMANIDPDLPAEQVPDAVLKEVKADEEILLEYTKSAKAEITLMCARSPPIVR